MTIPEIHAQLNSTLADINRSESVYRDAGPALDVVRIHLRETITTLIALAEEIQRLTSKPKDEFPTRVNLDMPRPSR